MTLTEILSVAVFVITYVVIMIDRLPRVMVVLAGAAAMVLIGAADAGSAFFAEDTGVDWNVIFLLLGMMMIVGMMRRTGVFEFLAIWSAKRAGGRPFAVLVMLVLITAVLSAFLDNVTTVLLIAPVTLLVCERLGVSPVPFLIAEIMASNIGGTATLIGDPPNIIIASRAGLSFNDFLINLAPFIVVLMGVFVALAWALFRRGMRYDPDRAARVMALNERDAIGDRPLLVKSLVVLALVLTGFLTATWTGMEPSVVALLGAGLLALLSRMEPKDIFGDVEWETLLFFAGLFVMVGALVNEGVIEQLAIVATDAIGGDYAVGAVGLVAGSAVLSGIIDNIPYVTTMAPLVGHIVDVGGDAAHPLWWALALGADLGGNATAIGASANVVVLGIAAKNGVHISFWRYTKYGLVVTAVSVALAIPYVLLRYF